MTTESKPLTRGEVLSWGSMGPMSLDPERVLAVVEERDELRRQLDAQAALLEAAHEKAKTLIDIDDCPNCANEHAKAEAAYGRGLDHGREDGRREALEEAAKVVEDTEVEGYADKERPAQVWHVNGARTLESAARRVRALASPPTAPGEVKRERVKCREQRCDNTALPNKPLCWQHGGDMLPDLPGEVMTCATCGGKKTVPHTLVGGYDSCGNFHPDSHGSAVCHDCGGTGKAAT